MKRKSIWSVVSCLMALFLLMASCAPAVTEEKEVLPPPEEKKEVASTMPEDESEELTQSTVPLITQPPTLVWDKTFGGQDVDKGQSVEQTPDGGYIITGATTSFGAGGEDLWLIRIDTDGNKAWGQDLWRRS